MALTSKNDPIHTIAVTVTIDGERAVLNVEPRCTVGDLIGYALAALDVDERASSCHLADHDLLYSPYRRIEDVGIEDGARLSLRLPL